MREEMVKALKTLDARMASNPSAMLAYPPISVEIREWISREPDLISKLTKTDGHTPTYVCLAAVNAIVEEGLTSGENHIYRGVLSSHGQALDAIFKVIALERLRLGFLSINGLRDERRQLDIAIAEAG